MVCNCNYCIHVYAISVSKNLGLGSLVLMAVLFWGTCGCWLPRYVAKASYDTRQGNASSCATTQLVGFIVFCQVGILLERDM